jgi:tetratricopeptide (TPR) repeat protein
MLYFRQEYRPKFGQYMKTVSGGTDSAQALMEIYGRTVQQVEKDLQAYLGGSTFQGALVTAKLEKATDDIPAEDLEKFDADVALAELLERPGKEAAAQAAWERLAQERPKRPEPYRGLGYLAWRDGKASDALAQFGKAFERGEREPKFLWDYGRLLERWRGEDAINVFRELLALDEKRVEVRMELAETQLRANHAVAALATLAPIQKVTPENSARFFRIAVYAQLQAGNLKDAAETATHFRDIARTDADRAEADRLVRQTTPREAAPAAAAATATAPENGQPTLRRREAANDRPPAAVAAPQRPSISGRFVQLDCRGSQARMIVETDAGRKTFLIEDPAKVAITSGSNGPVDMTCGPQKPAAKVEIGYDAPRAGQTGIDGIVRTLAF